MTFLSTFITGFGDVVKAYMPRGTHIQHQEDGLILYTTPANVRTILQLPFINNSYLLIQEFTHGESFTQILKQINNKPDILFKSLNQLQQKKTTFRLMATINNQLTPIEPQQRDIFEKTVMRNKLFITDRTTPNVEFLLMKRSSGKTFFVIRLTHHQNYEKTLKKGELYPELSYLLCLFSEPRKDDVFLDPFCGSGSIALTRAKYFPAEKIYATDTDKSATNYALLRAKQLRKRVEIFNWNALDLHNLEDGSITKIVTDPPWRLVDERYSLEVFYRDMLQEFVRILQTRGLCILLIENQQIIEKVLQEYQELKVIKKFTTLVSGRKAAVYKLIKLA